LATVLLGWELGRGIGYARRLALVAAALARLGHRPVLALRDPAATWVPAGAGAFEIVPAPYVIGRLKPGTRRFTPASFADLMACNGFGHSRHLTPLLAAWRGLLDWVRPALVVAEYSPALTLAAWRRVPTLLLGTPYLLPPAEEPWFPAHRSDWPAYAAPEEILTAMVEAQRQLGLTAPERMTQPFAEAARLVYGFPEIDPHAGRRREPLAGPFEPVPEATPPPAEMLLFAYLSPEAKGFAELADGLSTLGGLATAYIPDCPAGTAEKLGQAGVKVLSEPPPLATAVAAATLIFHHGGIDTAQTALALGRPQILAPRHLDQSLTAGLLVDLGLARRLSARVGAAETASALRQALADRQLTEAAWVRSQILRRRGMGSGLEGAVERAAAMLEG